MTHPLLSKVSSYKKNQQQRLLVRTDLPWLLTLRGKSNSKSKRNKGCTIQRHHHKVEIQISASLHFLKVWSKMWMTKFSICWRRWMVLNGTEQQFTANKTDKYTTVFAIGTWIGFLYVAVQMFIYEELGHLYLLGEYFWGDLILLGPIFTWVHLQYYVSFRL